MDGSVLVLSGGTQGSQTTISASPASSPAPKKAAPAPAPVDVGSPTPTASERVQQAEVQSATLPTKLPNAGGGCPGCNAGEWPIDLGHCGADLNCDGAWYEREVWNYWEKFGPMTKHVLTSISGHRQQTTS
jgi:hypothetical protein